MRSIAMILLLIASVFAHGQTMSAAETVKNYSIAQKRLLLVNTAQFANLLAQNNLDKDSVMVIASQITGLPLLLAYSEGFVGDKSEGTDLINSAKIFEAAKLVDKLEGAKKIRLLLELAMWYLHQPGIHTKDLDSANYYIERASKLKLPSGFGNWEIEGDFLRSELYLQKGDTLRSKEIISGIINFGLNKEKPEITARAYQLIGTLFPKNDSARNIYYQKSLALYQKLEFKEKQIEVLWEISNCNLKSNLNLMGDALYQILRLMRSTGFRHELYVQNIIAYVAAARLKFIDALKSANAGLDNVKWSGINSVIGAFYIRLGAIYGLLGKPEVAISWHKKALESGTNQTHLFWYKSLFFITELLNKMGRPEESLVLPTTATSKFPPLTLWDKIQVLSIKGYSYEKLKQLRLADATYMTLFNLKKKYPDVDTYGELLDTYEDIINFYISLGNLKKSDLFFKVLISATGKWVSDYGTLDQLLFRRDSLKGNYKAALQHHIQFKIHFDSLTSIEQRKKLDELTVQYASEKKDQDIKLLKQQGAVQQTELNQNKLTRNIMVAGTLLLLIIVGLLFSQFKLKQRTNAAMNKKNLALQRLVSEKEWLLKEVHHRVKNNLHTVISLLESQAAYLENDALKAIENSQHRIYAMSLIHQKLYQTENVKTIDMSVYLPEFIRYLNESFDTQYRIQFKIDIESTNLVVSQAIPIALVINEAVTNSIKYAFPQGRKGIIEISMHKNADEITLIIADDGIGIDESLLNAPSESLGLKLIKGLSADINAAISFKNDNGTKITIVFNVDPFFNNNTMADIDKKEKFMHKSENI